MILYFFLAGQFHENRFLYLGRPAVPPAYMTTGGEFFWAAEPTMPDLKLIKFLCANTFFKDVGRIFLVIPCDLEITSFKLSEV